MKNQSLQTLGLAVITAVALTACSGLGKLVKKADTITYKVTPDPLEMHGDSIKVAISGTYPAKVFPKKATVTTTPYIKYNGGEKALKPVVLIGEKVEGTGQKIANKAGGSFSYSDVVAYTPEMKVAILELRASGQVKKKVKELPAKKVADATIITPLLVKADDKAIIGKDAFVRVTKKSMEAQIFFTMNQSQVRGTEMTNATMKAMKAAIAANVANPATRTVYTGVNVSAYASPDGELSLNGELAEDRAKASIKALMAVFKDKKMKVDAAQAETFYNKVTTAEDWDGFKKAMEASSIADKDLILRVLTMYPDGEVREKEIKNLSKTYTVVADKILPQLRRSVLTLNMDVTGLSDAEITALVSSKPDSLTIEEILYAATLTQDINTKLDIYKKAEAKYASDWRTSNNVGYIYLVQNKLNDAEAQFKKADALSANNPIIKNNLGICARWKGDRKAAMEMYKAASGAGNEVSYNMGIIEIQNGNYAAAVSNFGSDNSFNSALAKLLNGNTEGAMSTIDNSTEKDAALSFYLKAIAGARQGKADVAVNNLKNAISKDASFKAMAKDDAEFIKLRENADFKAAVN